MRSTVGGWTGSAPGDGARPADPIEFARYAARRTLPGQQQPMPISRRTRASFLSRRVGYRGVRTFVRQYREHISHGLLQIVWPDPPETGALVQIDLKPPFSPRSYTIPSRVVHVHGELIGVEFLERDKFVLLELGQAAKTFDAVRMDFGRALKAVLDAGPVSPDALYPIPPIRARADHTAARARRGPIEVRVDLDDAVAFLAIQRTHWFRRELLVQLKAPPRLGTEVQLVVGVAHAAQDIELKAVLTDTRGPDVRLELGELDADAEMRLQRHVKLCEQIGAETAEELSSQYGQAAHTALRYLLPEAGGSAPRSRALKKRSWSADERKPSPEELDAEAFREPTRPGAPEGADDEDSASKAEADAVGAAPIAPAPATRGGTSTDWMRARMARASTRPHSSVSRRKTPPPEATSEVRTPPPTPPRAEPEPAPTPVVEPPPPVPEPELTAETPPVDARADAGAESDEVAAGTVDEPPATEETAEPEPEPDPVLPPAEPPAAAPPEPPPPAAAAEPAGVTEQGSFLERPPLEVFGQLGRDGATGMLTIEGATRTTKIAFRAGRIYHCGERPPRSQYLLGTLLIHLKADARKVNEASIQARDTGVPMGQLLLDARAIEEIQLSRALVTQLKTRIGTLDGWETGNFEFQAGVPNVPIAHAPMVAPVRLLFLGRLDHYARMAQRSATKEEGPHTQHYVTPDPARERWVAKLGFKRDQLALWELVRASRYKLFDLYDRSDLEPEEAFATLFALRDLGLICFHEQLDSAVRLEMLIERFESKSSAVRGSNLFEILEVHWTAGLEQVKEGYDRVKDLYDASTVEDAPEEIIPLSQAILKYIESAYETLKDTKARREYRESTVELAMIHNSAQLLIRQGDLSVFKQDWVDARDRFQQVLELIPGNREVQEKITKIFGLQRQAASRERDRD